MHEKSIELLNNAVGDELSAVHQYMFFHFHCNDQGYDLLAGLFKKTAIEEMDHIERCAERILFLGGEVEMTASLEVQKIHDVREMLALAKQMEVDSAKDYNVWANECSANNDAASKQVFEGLIDDEERHADQAQPRRLRDGAIERVELHLADPYSGAGGSFVVDRAVELHVACLYAVEVEVYVGFVAARSRGLRERLVICDRCSPIGAIGRDRDVHGLTPYGVQSLS